MWDFNSRTYVKLIYSSYIALMRVHTVYTVRTLVCSTCGSGTCRTTTWTPVHIGLLHRTTAWSTLRTYMHVHTMEAYQLTVGTLARVWDLRTGRYAHRTNAQDYCTGLSHRTIAQDYCTVHHIYIYACAHNGSVSVDCGN